MNFIVQHLEITLFIPKTENTYPYKLIPNYSYKQTHKIQVIS